MKKYLSNDFDLASYAEAADECPIWSAPFGLKLLNKIDYRKNIKALDIGFGTGFPLTEIALRLGESSEVFGIDPWTEATERARKKIAYFRLSNITILHGHAEDIPLDNNSIDLITSNNGINNVRDPEKVLRECSRLLKKGGQFIQTCNIDKTMFEFYSQMEDVLREEGMSKEIELMHKHIYEKRKPVGELIRMVRSNGFIIKDLDYDQFSYRFADGSAMLNHYFIRLAFMDSWIKLLPRDRINDVFGKIEAKLNKQAEMLNGMQLSIPFVLINAYKD